MSEGKQRRRGFTIIELMVVVAVMLVLALIAVPSFEVYRKRAAIRGAGEHVLSFWNQARLEAAKRNQMVKVGLVQSGGGTDFCLGAAVTTDPADTTPCDCTSASACDVARFPADQIEWRGVQLAAVTIGQSPDLDNLQPVVIEPKRTSLTDTAGEGNITLTNPAGRYVYRLNLHVDRFGRGTLCESTSATSTLPEFHARQCAD
jgi:prepilin-type N-terminal cleavage/methylation domain-containing protein